MGIKDNFTQAMKELTNPRPSDARKEVRDVASYMNDTADAQPTEPVQPVQNTQPSENKQPEQQTQQSVKPETAGNGFTQQEQTRFFKNILNEYELEITDTMELIRIIDSLYNAVIDPDFEKKNGSLERVMAVTLEELTEFGWEDYLNEEMYEEALENYVEKLTDRMTDIEDSSLTQDMEEKRKVKNKITVISEEALQKAHTYVELNFGKTYLTPAEEKRMNHLMCRGIHGDCSLYFTEGILKNPVRDNYQYQYAKRLRNKNIWIYHDKHRIAKRNIAILTELLKKALVIRSENQEVLCSKESSVEIIQILQWMF